MGDNEREQKGTKGNRRDLYLAQNSTKIKF
jgi:hypothetical protein